MKIARIAMMLFLGLALIRDAAAQEPAAYRPGLGDLMTMTIQPRHIKLALAGRAGNWRYAAYELHALTEAFDRAMAVWPQWRSIPVGEMERSVMRAPLDALDQAIKASDATGFMFAYGQLTAACNACHAASDRNIVVIQAPTQDTFPDQAFQPAP